MKTFIIWLTKISQYEYSKRKNSEERQETFNMHSVRCYFLVRGLY